MKLSIVVPVYNMAADGKLEYCIKSLLNQTMTDYEIIAVDDASTDDSLRILRQLEKENSSKLKVIASPVNHHQGGARNLGIKAAKGEFIGMMDSDDWAASDMFIKLLCRAEQTGADVVGCDYSLVHQHTMEIGQVVHVNDEDQTGELTPDRKRKLILKPGSMVVKIYRREIIIKNQLWFPEDIFYEDNCMSPLWLLHCTHFERVPQPLYYYYQNEASTVHHISESKLKDRMKAMVLLIEKSKEYGFYDEYKPELEFKFAELYLVNTLFSLMGSKTKGKYRLAKELREGILSRFPHFCQNRYYQSKIGKEEQKLVSQLLKSPLLFYTYYQLLWCYRRVRGVLGGKRK